MYSFIGCGFHFQIELNGEFMCVHNKINLLQLFQL